jgi:hypothetical protein
MEHIWIWSTLHWSLRLRRYWLLRGCSFVDTFFLASFATPSKIPCQLRYPVIRGKTFTRRVISALIKKRELREAWVRSE